MGQVNFTTRPCAMCGKSSEVTLDAEKLERWQDGEFVQNVWPEKSPDERELLITGTHPECWNKLFPPEEQEEFGNDELFPIKKGDGTE